MLYSEDYRKIKLANGMELQTVAFGPDELGYTPRRKKRSNFRAVRAVKKIKRLTWDSNNYANAVGNAMRVGLRYIDYSAAYGDGSLIKKAINKAGLTRDDVILQTRVSNKAQFKGSQAVEEELVQQLRGFQTDCVDILMFHWPVTDCFENTWETMIKLRDKGYCKALGVANCHEHHIDRLHEVSGCYPLINQVEIHPLFTQEKLRMYCAAHDIAVEAYTSTGRQDDRIMNPPLMNELAKKYNKSKTQIILRWHIQNGIIPVFRSFNYEHQKSNFDIYDFCISDEDMKKIDSLNINSRLRYDPDNCDFTCL